MFKLAKPALPLRVAELPPIDAVFCVKKYHLSPEDAARAGAALGAEHVLPCHFGTFRIAFDLPQIPLARFAR